METSTRDPVPVTDSERLETLGLLAAGLAHEVASPLQAIVHNLRYLQDGLAGLDPLCQQGSTLPAAMQPEVAAFVQALAALTESYPLEELQAALADSVEAAQRASVMVHAIAEFAQAGTSAEALDVAGLVASVSALTRNAWKYVAEIETVVPPDLPRVRANRRVCSVAFARLMLEAARRVAGQAVDGEANALQRILVEASVQAGHVVLAVTAAGQRQEIGLGVAEA